MRSQLSARVLPSHDPIKFTMMRSRDDTKMLIDLSLKKKLSPSKKVKSPKNKEIGNKKTVEKSKKSKIYDSKRGSNNP